MSMIRMPRRAFLKSLPVGMAAGWAALRSGSSIAAGPRGGGGCGGGGGGGGGSSTIDPPVGAAFRDGNIPAGYATEGTWYDFFADKASASCGATWGPGYATFQYPNANRASTIWYHDHGLGMTRLNVYAGPAGFYIIRGGPGDVVLDSLMGAPAVLPGPAPKANDKFPPNKTYYEIPIAIQDRSFNTDGSLFYPDTRAFFDGATAEDPGYTPQNGSVPDLEPRVLREHDDGQRHHLSLSDR